MTFAAGNDLAADELNTIAGYGTVIARGRRTSNSSSTSSTTELGVLRVDSVSLTSGNLYLISTGSVLVDASVAADIYIARLRISTSGNATTSSTQLVATQRSVASISQPEDSVLAAFYAPAADETLSVLLTIQRTSGTGVFLAVGATTTPIDLYVVNCGIDPGDSGTDI